MNSQIVSKRKISFVAVTLFLLFLFLISRDVVWQGNEEAHTISESLDALIAFVLGASALTRYYSKKDESIFLLIGVGFLGTGFLELYHAIVTSEFLVIFVPAFDEQLMAWSWLSSRLFLSLLMMAAYFNWKYNWKITLKPSKIYFATVIVTLLIFFIFTFFSLPQACYLKLFFHRPEELLPALFFAVALYGFYMKGGWKENSFEFWLILSLIVNIAVQTLFMLFSQQLLDYQFEMAHLLKKVSYILVLIGIFIDMFHLFKREHQSKLKLEEQKTELETLHNEILQHNTQLQLSAEIAGLVYWEYDLETNKFKFNDDFYKFLDTSAERENGYEMELESFLEEFVSLQSQTIVLSSMQDIYNHTKSYSGSVKYTISKRSDESVIVLMKYYVMYNHEGKPVKAFGTMVNITEQEKHDNALLRSQHQALTLAREQNVLLSLFEKGEAVLFKWRNDEQWSVSYVSQSVSKLLEVDVSDFLEGKITYSSLIHPDDIAQVSKEVEEAIEENLDYFKHLPYRLITPSGVTKWVIDYTVTEKDEDGNILHFIGYILDITESKQKEYELLSLNNKLKSIANTVSDTLYTLDIDGIIQIANIAIYKLLGYKPDEVVGKSAHELFHYEYVDGNRVSASECSVMKSIKAGQPYNSEQRFMKKDGTIITVELDSNPLIINDEIVGSVTVCRDLSVQKEMMQVLEDAKVSAEEASRLKSDFLANMSHEIRTPMNAVTGLSKLLLDTALDNHQKEYVKNINKSSNALLGILNEILDFSKIEANRIEIENHPFHTEEILEHINSLFATATAQKGLELIFDIEPTVPDIIDGDKMRILQVMSNLVGNAIKFTDRGEIHIRVDSFTEQRSRFLEIHIRDTGIGISEQQLQKLFKPFTQADSSTTRKYGGTGLGLIISKRLVELMGGEMHVVSQTGEGSTFSFRIALQETQTKSIPKRYADKLQGMKTLIVDDLESSVVALEKMLDSLQFDVTTTTSPLEALKLYEDAYTQGKPFELVVADWKMPELDGLLLAEKMKKYVTDEVVPIIVMLTAFDREQFLAQEKSENAYAVLNKPTTPSTLFNTIIDIQYGKHSVALANKNDNDYLAYINSLQGKRALLVEDNETNRIVARGFLEKMGLEIDIAEDGVIALDKVAQNEYDIILMDIQMPNMNGLEATERLRQNGFVKPIVAMSAAAMQSDIEAALKAGMNDHIAKPIDDEKLAFTLLKYLDEKAYNELPKDLQRQKQRVAVEDGEYTYESVKEHFSGDEKLMQKALYAFVYDLQSVEDAFVDALAAKDTQKLKDLAHKLKGAAGNLGAHKLSRVATEYETKVIQSSDIEAKELLEELRDIKVISETLLRELQQSDEIEHETNIESLSKLIREIAKKVNSHRLVDDTLLEELYKSGVKKEMYEQLVGQTDAFDYENAKQTVRQIEEFYGVDDE